jgi:hypothetical protein
VVIGYIPLKDLGLKVVALRFKSHLQIKFLPERCVFSMSGKLFVCPECGKHKLYLHRKTYEQIIIVCCDSCHFNSSFEPSKEAYYDENEAWKEFKAKYRAIQTSFH